MSPKHWMACVAVIFATLTSVLTLHGQNNNGVMALQERMVELFEEHRSAMVRVKAVYQPEDGEDVPQVVIGSGFFISREGLILTNASIVFKPVRVWVEHKNVAYSADIIGTDARSNIALLRVHTLPDSFSYFHLVDSAELPKTGSLLLRLSMPLEFESSPSFGMVSGFESRFGDRIFPCTYIRTSIPAGPGDGGSAYVDMSGKLLGIQVGSLPEVGASYMLPARAALRIRDDLLFSGEVNYGWIGFEVDEDSSIQQGQRIMITEVFEDTPAENAGLLKGDVITQIGEYEVLSLEDLRNAMFYTRIGQYVDVNIKRDGKLKKFSVKVAERPEDEPLQIIREGPAPERNTGPLKDELESRDSNEDAEDLMLPEDEGSSSETD